MARAESGKPLQALDFSSYALSDPDDPTSIEGWDKARSVAMSALEYQKGRQANLDLLLQYGGNSHRLSNHLLEHAYLPGQLKNHQAVQDRIDRLNAKRQASHLEAGERLDGMDKKWSGLIRNVIQISLASRVLQSQMGELRREKKKLRRELDLSKRCRILGVGICKIRGHCTF